MTLQPIALRVDGDNIRVVASPHLLSSAGAAGGGLDAEAVRDTIAAALVAGANITITVNDGADTITIGATGLELSGAAATAIAAHVAAADPHPTYTTSAELTSALTAYLTSAAAPELIRDTIGTALVAGSNITLTVNDAGDTITIAGPDLTSYLTSAAAPELIRDTIGATLVAGANVTITVNDAGDTITIAASGGGGGAANAASGFEFSGYWVPPGASSGGNEVWNAGEIHFAPLVLAANATADRIGVSVHTAGSAGTRVRLGIYNTTNGRPSTLLVDGGLVLADTTGAKEVVISQALTAGVLYALAVQLESVTIRLHTNPAANQLAAPAANTLGAQSVLASGSTSGALPSTVTPSTNGKTPPLIRVRLV